MRVRESVREIIQRYLNAQAGHEKLMRSPASFQIPGELYFGEHYCNLLGDIRVFSMSGLSREVGLGHLRAPT
jgi:hypothetical protein